MTTGNNCREYSTTLTVTSEDVNRLGGSVEAEGTQSEATAETEVLSIWLACDAIVTLTSTSAVKRYAFDGQLGHLSLHKTRVVRGGLSGSKEQAIQIEDQLHPLCTPHRYTRFWNLQKTAAECTRRAKLQVPDHCSFSCTMYSPDDFTHSCLCLHLSAKRGCKCSNCRRQSSPSLCSRSHATSRAKCATWLLITDG